MNKTGSLNIQHIYSNEFSIGQGIFESPLLISCEAVLYFFECPPHLQILTLEMNFQVGKPEKVACD